jgi:uncharacterized membrane protein YhaH (DUF805 family)
MVAKTTENGAMMGFIPALFGFKGRMRRRDFWFYTVLSNLGLFILLLIDIIVPQLIFPQPRAPDPVIRTGPASIGIAIMFLLTLALMAWMAAALLAKRLHDRDKPGWFALAALVPVVGWVWLFVECGCLDARTESNRFGPSPKASV